LIKERFNVIAIPQLIVINTSNGEVINLNARNEVFLKGSSIFKEWITSISFPSK
jgi:hypothetical protein